jgi:hypothetical protein
MSKKLWGTMGKIPHSSQNNPLPVPLISQALRFHCSAIFKVSLLGGLLHRYNSPLYTQHRIRGEISPLIIFGYFLATATEYDMEKSRHRIVNPAFFPKMHATVNQKWLHVRGHFGLHYFRAKTAMPLTTIV